MGWAEFDAAGFVPVEDALEVGEADAEPDGDVEPDEPDAEAPDDDGPGEDDGAAGVDVVVGTTAGVVPLGVDAASPFFVHVQLASRVVNVDSSRPESASAPVRVMK